MPPEYKTIFTGTNGGPHAMQLPGRSQATSSSPGPPTGVTYDLPIPCFFACGGRYLDFIHPKDIKGQTICIDINSFSFYSRICPVHLGQMDQKDTETLNFHYRISINGDHDHFLNPWSRSQVIRNGIGKKYHRGNLVPRSHLCSEIPRQVG